MAETIEQRLQSISPQIMSESRLERIITELDLYPNKRGKRGGMEEIVADMRSDINVEIMRGDLFRVTYTGSNPYKVMQVTQRLASLFVEENLKDREQLAVGTNRFLESQLDNTRRALEEQERKVRNTGRLTPVSCRPRSARTSRCCRRRRSSSSPAKRRSAAIAIGASSSSGRSPS